MREKKKRIESPPFIPETVKSFCPRCKRPITMRLYHYDAVRCGCRTMLWALRPLRYGPLQLFLHPGFPDRHPGWDPAPTPLQEPKPKT